MPAASDHAVLQAVVGCFVERQGAALQGGVVLRAFAELVPIGRHSRSELPLTREFRTFWLDGAPLLAVPYWDEGAYTAAPPPVAAFAPVAARVQSRFFSMDLAEQQDGRWIVIEIGDGQVSGLPERSDLTAFYRGLARSLARR